MPYKVTWLSRYAIERIAEPAVIISIGDPGETLPKFNCPVTDLLRLEFHDIEFPIRGYDHFNYNHANKVLRFNERWKDHDLIVHCTAGISRSCAIACFLSDHLDRVLDVSHPLCVQDTTLRNDWVYHQLSLAYLDYLK